MVIPPAADEEAVPVEEADVDAVTVRVDGTSANVDVLEQALAFGEIVANDRVDTDPRRGCFLVPREQGLLFTPVL